MVKVLLGVTGGIAVYKALEVVRLLTKAGAQVRVVMTRNSQAFVTPLSFSTLSGHPVATELLDPSPNWEIEHIELARWADLVLIAPATANLIGKLAGGIADDLLSTVLMAVPGTTPLVLAPAMNTRMWTNPVLQYNLEKLTRLLGPRFHIIPPESRDLACGEVGVGALAAPEVITAATLKLVPESYPD